MAKLGVIEPKVTSRCCPFCFYEMSQQQIAFYRINIPCPDCGKKTINDFVPASEK